MQLREVYTTGQVAAILGVSQQTVIRCFDMGTLGGYRVPFSKFRRVPHADLVRFAEANGIGTALEEIRDAEALKAAEALAPAEPDPREDGDPYTTGELSGLLQVAPRTVSKWIDSGEIQGYRVPGSADRRVSKKAFEAFLASHPGFRAQVERRWAAIAAAVAEAETPEPGPTCEAAGAVEAAA